jgi:formamidopyrimidine-DNA glycosylase
MPELPEVEEVRRSMEPHLLGQTITAVRVLRRDFLAPPGARLDRLIGRRIVRTHRHGKNLFLSADDGQTLHLHLGMTGRVDCLPQNVPPFKHTHVILELAAGTHIRFRDPRRFGGLVYYPTLEMALAAETGNLGPDALAFTARDLAHWHAARGRLKQRLLAQHDVAGLGNIYVDESLWEARLHPLQRVDRLTSDQIERLVRVARRILRRSIALGGTTVRDYRNAADEAGRFARRLRVYGRAGQPCRRCHTTLAKATIAGRTSVFCPRCQKRT